MRNFPSNLHLDDIIWTPRSTNRSSPVCDSIAYIGNDCSYYNFNCSSIIH